MPPEIPIRSKIDEITEFIVQNVSREKDYSSIVYLNLFSNRIKKMKCLEKLVNLNTLVLSFNEVEQVDGLGEMKALKRLDLNHNFIRKIENLEQKPLMAHLNLTNNWIADIAQIEHLRVNCQGLRELSLKCNPLSAKKSYRATVWQRLQGLIKLDGIAITDKDKERVKNENVVITKELIGEVLKSVIKNVDYNSIKTKKDNALDDDSSSEWERTIETLILNHKQIVKIEALDAFANLRKLLLVDNCIQKIEGVNKCKLLEELSLEKNKITYIENISHLRYLKKLDLGRNRIKKIDGLT